MKTKSNPAKFRVGSLILNESPRGVRNIIGMIVYLPESRGVLLKIHWSQGNIEYWHIENFKLELGKSLIKIISF